VNISRLYGLEKVDLNLEFCSPAFLGGADSQPELRSAPFKAALRWWWRVLYGGGNAGARELKEAEDGLFGSTETGSRVRLGVTGQVRIKREGFPGGEKVRVTSKGKTFSINILEYLTYGLFDYVKGQGNVYNRSHIPVGEQFHLAITLPKDKQALLLSCINACLTFGGVGSRSRNGFGSMILREGGEKLAIPKEAVGSGFLKRAPMEYPTLNRQSKLFVTPRTYDTWEEALSELGIAYRNARTALEPRHRYELRGLIARPIEVKGERIPPNIQKGRHPKQFLLHVGKRKGKYEGRILTLPVSLPRESYSAQEREKHPQVMKDMYGSFSSSLKDMTQEIIPCIRGNA
jgi:CRISPR-associated protein Cmr1